MQEKARMDQKRGQENSLFFIFFSFFLLLKANNAGFSLKENVYTDFYH